jgi:hypothetical protein
MAMMALSHFQMPDLLEMSRPDLGALQRDARAFCLDEGPSEECLK